MERKTWKEYAETVSKDELLSEMGFALRQDMEDWRIASEAEDQLRCFIDRFGMPPGLDGEAVELTLRIISEELYRIRDDIRGIADLREYDL